MLVLIKSRFMPTNEKYIPREQEREGILKQNGTKQQPIANYIAKFQYSNVDGLLTEINNRKLDPFVLQPTQLSAL